MKKIASKDIYLIPFTEEFIPLFHEWRNNMDVIELASPVIEQYTLEETVLFVKQAMLSASDGEHFIIMHSLKDTAIGYVSIINIDFDNFSADCMIEIGDAAHWGKSYGSMAMEVIMEYVFKELNLNRLGLQVFDFNERALKMYERLGFKKEGRRREAIWRLGDYFDIILMSMLRNEYNAKKLPLN